MDFKEIAQSHQVVVKEMGILDQNISISYENLKDISFDLGMTEEGWSYILQLADEKFQLAQKHFTLKSFDSCVQESEQAQLLNPFLKGVRGLKSKAFLLRALHEHDDTFLTIAEAQAKLTIEKEPNDKNALEVLATISSKKRVVKNDAQKIGSKKIIIGFILTLLILLVFIFGINWSSIAPAQQESKQAILAIEKQLESAFEKQEAIIPKVKTFIKGTQDEELLLSQLLEIETKLKNENITIEKRYQLNNELNAWLSTIIYDASYAQDSPLLKDIRVLLEGAENRIKIERKNYNAAVNEYNSTIGSNEQPLKNL